MYVTPSAKERKNWAATQLQFNASYRISKTETPPLLKNGLMNASTQFVQSSSWILLQSSTLFTTFRRAEWLSGQKIVELKQAVSWHVQVFEHLQMYWSGLNRKKSRKPKVCCWSSHWSQALWSVLVISLTEAPQAFLDFLMFCKSYTPVSLY